MVKEAFEKPDDEALMRAAQAGDLQAFDQLAECWQPRMLSFCLRRLGSKEAAEDAVQEALLKAWRFKAGFRFESRTSTWLFALASNACRDVWRRTRPEGSLEEPGVKAAAEASRYRNREEAPDAALLHAEMSSLLLEAVESLDDKSAELMKARGQGRNLADAGNLLGLSPQAARAKASRAYKKLREALKKRMR